MDQSELRKITLIETLQPDTRQEILRRAYPVTYPPGHTILVEGMPAESCYFLLSGSVRVLRMNQEGRVQVLARLGTGAPINFISVLSGERNNRSTVETLTAVRLLTLSANDFDYLLGEHPDFARLLLHIFAERISHMTDLAANLSLFSVRSRLAKFLIDLADQKSHPGTGWTQDEIAAQIGTVRDVVGRLLREFEAEGLIRRDRQKVILLNRPGLFKKIHENS